MSPSEETVVARVCARQEAADGVVALEFEADETTAPFAAWAPGAHVDLSVPGLGVERQYSLCGRPEEGDRWTIAVLYEPAGRGGSEWVYTQLAVGDRVELRGPRNHFALEHAGEYIFLAGGIGITPILPMVERVARGATPWHLFYGGRTRASMAFVDRLAAYGDRVTVWPQDVHGLLPLADILGTPRSGVAVYCCGPEPLLAAAEERCRDWPAGSLNVERFAPRPGALAGPRQTFEVVAERSGVSVTVLADESIVEALASAGVEVPTSCREGTCGTCETVVLEGDVDHRDSFLSEDERSGGETMMPCCSRALTDRLVLDV